MEKTVGVATRGNDFIDISKNLTIDQMVERAYRRLSSEQKAQVNAISRRTGIHVNDLLKEALEHGLAQLRKRPNPSGSRRDR